MRTKTGIEWTETTWNPTTDCDRISEGCDNCYALAMGTRQLNMQRGPAQLAGALAQARTRGLNPDRPRNLNRSVILVRQ